jgi:hypothetical protein
VPSILYQFGYAYDVKGYGSFEVFYDQDQALFIQLVSPRDQHKRGYAPDAADWSLAKAKEIVQRFLPADARSDQPVRNAQGNILTACYSASLAKAVKAATYAAYHLRGQPGDCQYTFYLSDAGQVFAIEIGLGDANRALAPLAVPGTPAAKPSSTPVGQVPTNLRPEERSYVDIFKTQEQEIRTSITQFNQLINDPKPSDSAWTANLDNVLTTWQALYRNAQTMTPPARLKTFHASYLQMLSLLSSAAGDISNGISNNDAALINSAGTKLQRAFAILGTLDGELDKVLSGS